MKKFILPLLLVSGMSYSQYYSGPDTRNQPKGAEEAAPIELSPQEAPASPTEAPVLLDDAAPEAATNGIPAEALEGLPMPINDMPAELVENAPVLPLENTPLVEEIIDTPPPAEYMLYDEGSADYQPAAPAIPRPEVYPDIDPNKVQGIIIQMPFTNIIIKPPYAPYQTYDTMKLKSGRIPDMLSDRSLLQNLHKTSWRLKFYGHPDSKHLDSLLLDISDNDILVTAVPKGGAVSNIAITPAANAPKGYEAPSFALNASDKNKEVSSYRLTLVKSLRPGEGIYAYDAGKGIINFMYIRLLMPHLLAFDMALTYDEIALCPDKSVTDMGVFTLE